MVLSRRLEMAVGSKKPQGEGWTLPRLEDPLGEVIIGENDSRTPGIPIRVASQPASSTCSELIRERTRTSQSLGSSSLHQAKPSPSGEASPSSSPSSIPQNPTPPQETVGGSGPLVETSQHPFPSHSLLIHGQVVQATVGSVCTHVQRKGLSHGCEITQQQQQQQQQTQHDLERLGQQRRRRSWGYRQCHDKSTVISKREQGDRNAEALNFVHEEECLLRCSSSSSCSRSGCNSVLRSNTYSNCNLNSRYNGCSSSNSRCSRGSSITSSSSSSSSTSLTSSSRNRTTAVSLFQTPGAALPVCLACVSPDRPLRPASHRPSVNPFSVCERLNLAQQGDRETDGETDGSCFGTSKSLHSPPDTDYEASDQQAVAKLEQKRHSLHVRTAAMAGSNVSESSLGSPPSRDSLSPLISKPSPFSHSAGDAVLPQWNCNNSSRSKETACISPWCELEGSTPCRGPPVEAQGERILSSVSWPLENDAERETASLDFAAWALSQGDNMHHHTPVFPIGSNTEAEEANRSPTDSSSSRCCCCSSSGSSSCCSADASSNSSCYSTEQETASASSEEDSPFPLQKQQTSCRFFDSSSSSKSSSSSFADAAAEHRLSTLLRADCFVETLPSGECCAAAAVSDVETEAADPCCYAPLWLSAREEETRSQDRQIDSSKERRDRRDRPRSNSRDNHSNNRGSSSSSGSISGRRRRSAFSGDVLKGSLPPEGSKRLRRGSQGAPSAHSSVSRVARGPPEGPPAPALGPPLVGPLGPLHAGVLIFDWDDTFFPNSWLAGRCLSLGSDPKEYESEAPLLRKLTRSGKRVLEAAGKIGSVVLVTNAAQGWIDETCKKFLPGLWGTVQTLRRVSARFHFDSPTCESPFLWKRLAFKEELDRHLSEHMECKTVVSIGDGPHEREALFCLQAEYSNKCRFSCKSLKLTELPSLERLNKQHALLLHSLEDLLGHDGDLDLCVRGPEEDDTISFLQGIEPSLLSADMLVAPSCLQQPSSSSGSTNSSSGQIWGALTRAPNKQALRLLNVRWSSCKRGRDSLLRIDHHLALLSGDLTECYPH